MRAARIVRERAGAEPAAPLKGTLPEDTEKAVAAAPARARSGARTAIVWGGLGFLTGAAFWHAVGFWGFVTEVVLNGSSETRAVIELADAPSPTPVSAGARDVQLPTVYLVDAANCTALVLDRPSNRTQQAPCPQGGLVLQLEPSGEREDLAGLTSKPTLQRIGYRR